jgi:hypothetical protein
MDKLKNDSGKDAPPAQLKVLIERELKKVGILHSVKKDRDWR